MTVAGTLSVVIIEFLLLTAVYQRSTPLDHQAVLTASLAAEWRSVPPDGFAAARADTDDQLAQLARAGASQADLAPIRKAVSSVGPATGAEGRSAVVAAVDGLAGRIASAKHRDDVQADWAYALLLVSASAGWMLWFRRLVRRHRILEHRLTEEQSRAEGEERLAALVRQSADVIAVCDLDGTVRFVTSSCRPILGRGDDELVGKSLTGLIVEEDRLLFQRLLASVPGGEDRPLVVRARHADGRSLHVEGTVSNLLADPAVDGLVVTLRDVSSRFELESQLAHQAFHDPLTGLANRQLFTDRLDHALARRDGIERPLAVLVCDLDDFKHVNDSLGRDSGDRVLEVVSRRIERAVRPGDTVARLGGDEFAVLLEEADQAQAEAVATRLLAAVGEPISLDDTVVLARASIGLSAATPGATSAEEALRNADVAMYMAKERGKATFAVYEAELHAETLDRLALRADLQKAIRHDELVLHFQPTIDLADGRVAGFEALVRWNHPQRGLLPPGLFVPVAEQTGLIHSLGSWVLKAACRAALDLCAGSERTMSVNVSSQQLARDDFVGEVFEVIATTGVRPEQLVLEITETALVKDLDLITERLTALRRRGIRIAIDDFGTGYNSLANLRNLPIDVLKVDKSFVDCVVSRDQDAALTQAILQMSASMDLVTVAEGVEHADQAEWLTEVNCRYGQGYLWSRPVPMDEARALVRESAAGRVA